MQSYHARFGIMALALATTATAALAAEQCATAPVTVGFISKLDSDPYFTVSKQGAEEAQGEIGGKVFQQSPNQQSAEAQISFINSFVSQKVGVIAISSNDLNALAPALKRAAQQGVKVVSFDSDVAASARGLFFNQAKSDSVAEMLLQSMGDLIGYEGEFGVLQGTPTNANQNSWVEYMKKQLKDNPKFAKMKLVQVVYGQGSEQTSQQQILALTQNYPNLKGISVPDGLGMPAAARALEQANLLGKIKLTGLAPASLLRKYIEGGSVQDVWWNVKDLGYLTYYGSQAYAQCKISGKPGETFEAGRLGKYTVGEGGEVVLGPAQIVTAKNVDVFKF